MSIIQHKISDQILKANSDKDSDDMFNNIHHEIRTPLNAIIGFSQLLGVDDLSNEKIKSYSEIIEYNTNRLLGAIEDILELNTMDLLSISNERFSIVDLLDELKYEFLKEIFDENKNIKLIIGANSLKECIISDKKIIKEVYKRLFSNAKKYTYEGEIEFGCYDEGSKVIFYMKDSGIGVPNKYYDKIFEPFFRINHTSNNFYHGIGLGLTICKLLVMKLQGELWLKSEPHKGTSFYFTLLC